MFIFNVYFVYMNFYSQKCIKNRQKYGLLKIFSINNINNIKINLNNYAKRIFK